MDDRAQGVGEPWEQIRFPTVVLTVPDGVVVAATRCAHTVLGRRIGTLVGRRVDDALDDAPSGALGLVATGQLSGYELVRRSRPNSEPISVWVRAVPMPDRLLAVAFLLPRPDEAPDRSPSLVAAKATGVGALRADGTISWASSDVEHLLARPSAHLVGRRLTDFVPPELAARLRRVTDAALRDQRVASQPTRVTLPGHGDRPMQLLVLPAGRPGTAVFLLVPGRPLDREAAESSTRAHPALARLSSREGDIVLALAAGDRVPAIAQNLSLSQGTVRNYLSSIFRKVGVSTQQELIERLRRD